MDALAEKTEHPDRDAVSMSDFGIRNSEIAVGNILDLGKTLLAAADLEKPFAIDEDIACRRIFKDVFLTQLVHEEAFPESAGIRVRDERRHKIGIVAVNFVGTRKIFKTVGIGTEKGEEPSPFKDVNKPEIL